MLRLSLQICERKSLLSMLLRLYFCVSVCMSVSLSVLFSENVSLYVYVTHSERKLSSDVC